MDATNNCCSTLFDNLSSKNPAEQEDALISAALDNDLQVVKAIVECFNTNCDKALFYAASQGHLQAVQLLLQRADPKANNSEAFRVACQFGMLDVVKALLPLSDPQCNNNNPLRAAASGGHTEVVRCILPFTNPKDLFSAALLSAAFHQHWEIADMLFDVSDVQKVYANLQRCGPGPWNNFEYEVHSRRQKTRIAEEIDGNTTVKRSKKI